MRNMSFSLTTPQFLEGSKTVTRRLGWRFLKPGDRVRAVEKAQGLKRGERVKPLGVIEIVSVRDEPLDAIDADDCRREGFPDLSPGQFVEMFCGSMGCKPSSLVRRIEFRRVEA